MKNIKIATALLITLISIGGNIRSIEADQSHDSLDSL